MNSARTSAPRDYPVEDFIHALTKQLDDAQDALAIKARLGRPLTWALKDLSLELKVFLNVDPNTGKVLLRSAGPNESGASTLHVNLTTITRPMVEENTRSFDEDLDPRPLSDIRAAVQLDEGEQRRLEWMGVRTVGQLKELSRGKSPKAVETMLGIPALRLRAALEAASRPVVTGSEVVRQPDGRRLLRVHGANFNEGGDPEVLLAGEPVEVLESASHQLLVRPMEHHAEGQVEVFAAGQRAAGFFRIPKDGDAGARRAAGEP